MSRDVGKGSTEAKWLATRREVFTEEDGIRRGRGIFTGHGSPVIFSGRSLCTGMPSISPLKSPCVVNSISPLKPLSLTALDSKVSICSPNLEEILTARRPSFLRRTRGWGGPF